jgi:hypothetical protein
MKCQTMLGRGWRSAQRESLNVNATEALTDQNGIVHVVDNGGENQPIHRRNGQWRRRAPRQRDHLTHASGGNNSRPNRAEFDEIKSVHAQPP